MSKYSDAVEQWEHEMSIKFYDSIKEVLDPNLSDTVKMNIAESLAKNFIDTGNCEIFDMFHLTENQAYCFLNDVSGQYQSEVNEAYDEDFQGAKEDGELSAYESCLDDCPQERDEY